MDQIKPIETIYSGYRFRSRLEARWAIFFDEANIEYRYETEGFENEYGDRYLPDFYLPNTKTWVEVKGDKDALCRDYKRMTGLLDFGGCLPDFKDSPETSRGLLLLGDVPDGAKGGVYFHPLIHHDKGLWKEWAYFKPYANASKAKCVKDYDLLDLFDISVAGSLECGPDDWRVETKWAETPKYWPKISNAYTAARQARFEYDERKF